LTVSDCVFSGNSAGGSRGAGGGLNNIGTATVKDSVFSGNSAGGAGGGISGLQGLIQSGNTFTGNSPDNYPH
jgi:predicted outer membrane repeat protein